jgi:hypothetical protein
MEEKLVVPQTYFNWYRTPHCELLSMCYPSCALSSHYCLELCSLLVETCSTVIQSVSRDLMDLLITQCTEKYAHIMLADWTVILLPKSHTSNSPVDA